MGVRQDKGRAVARYIVGNAGIPMVTWTTDGLEAPYPYQLLLTTGRKLEDWHEILRGPMSTRIKLAIRFDNSLPDVSAAWVGMSLEDACILLDAHYRAISERTEQ